MKKYLLLTALAVIFYFNAKAQCKPAIPSNAVVVDSTVTINGGFDPVWVCKGDTLFSNGGFHNVYLETGSVMSTGGGIDTIFVKKSALLIMNGGIHYIYYEDNNDLSISGGIPTLDSCTAINFDYFNAPVSGCFANPVASFASTDTSFCENKCLNFTDLTYNNPINWQWYFPGAIPDTSTVQNPAGICYSSYGSFDVVLVACNSNGCDSIYLPGFINEYPNPPTPVITQSGDTLFSSPSFSYQWIDTTNVNSILSTDSFFVPQQAGNYYVNSCDSSGCCTPSAIISIIGAGIPFHHGATVVGFTVFPNPNNGNFSIYTSKRIDGEISISVYNVQGKEIFNITENNIPLDFSNRINLAGHEAGIYVIKITAGDFLQYIKMAVAG